jgi:hypothetical protein
MEAVIKSVLNEHRSSQCDLETSISVGKAKVTDLRDRAKRAYLDHNIARSDHER